MRVRAWLLPALLATPLLLPVDGALACIRFKKPAGAIPPGLREPSDPPPAPPPTTPPTTTPSDPSTPPPATTAPSGPDQVGPTTPAESGPMTEGEKGEKKKQANDYSTWETWWVLNRIEFFPHRYVTQTISTEGPTPKGAMPLSAELVRSKLWPTLLQLKDDKQAFVREAALITIGRVASDDALKTEARKILLEAMKDKNHLVARAAVLGLFYVADAASIWRMREIADDPKAETDLRAFVAMTLPALPGDHALATLQRLVKVDREADFELKCAALTALGYVKAPEALTFLKEVYADAKEYRAELRAAAIESLGRRGVFADGWELASKALDDKEIPIRRSAAIALGVLDYRTDAEREIAALMAPYDALHNAKVPADVQAKVDGLKKLVPDQREVNRKHVRTVVKKLVHALQHDNDSFVASMSAISLGRIASQCDEDFAIRSLVTDLKKERYNVREYELLALAIAKAPTAYDLALAAVTAKNSQPTTVGAGMIALGILGDARAVETLHGVLENASHPMLRGTAAVALGMLGDERSAGPILSLVKTTKSPDAMADGALAIALLGQVAGKKGSDLLVKKLTDTADGNVAAYTIYSLGLMKDRSKLDALLDIAKNHGNFFVQSAGVAAIGYVSSAEDYPMRHLMARGFNYMLNLQLLEQYFYKL
jgi:HEAT repeat protein